MNELEITDISGEVFRFESLRELALFLEDEINYWKEAERKVSESEPTFPSGPIHNAIRRSSSLASAKEEIETLVKESSQISERDLRNKIDNLRRNHLGNLRNSWLWSGHEFSHPFVEIHCQHGNESAQSFLDTVLLKQRPDMNNYAKLYGTLAAYEFNFQDSDIVKRRKGEKISLGRIRKSFIEKTDNLFNEVDKKIRLFDEWEQKSKERSDRLNDAARRLCKAKIHRADRIFRENMEEWKDQVETLELTYEEKLKLEKPAQYWDTAASRHRSQGRMWSALLIVVLSAGLLGGGAFFLSWLESERITLALASLQGVVLFGAIAALYAFFLRIIAKMVLSSFHLMRDAQERSQLTYLYLALTKDSDIGKESRDIVLQALFSRTDTGLLAGDSSPTMPTASEAIRRLSRTNT